MLYIGTNNGKGFTALEIERGLVWAYVDVTCQHCGKEQPVMATGHVGGPCVRCGKATLGCCACEGGKQ